MTFLEHLKHWLKAESSGLNKLSNDIRDLYFRDLVKQRTYTPKAQVKRLAPVWVKDQLRHGNCSFQAHSAALGVYFGDNVSARWLTAKAWQQGLCEKGGGADMRNGAKIAQKFGVVFESELKSDESLPWDEYIDIDFDHYDKIAATRKIGSYYRLTNLDEVLVALDQGYGVVIGRTWLTGMNRSGGFSAPWILPRTGLSVGGHATCAIGYDQDKGTDIEVNSYSDRWGDQGYFYTPLDDNLVRDFRDYGAFAITPIPYTPKEVKIGLMQQVINLAALLLAEISKKKL